MVDIEGHVEGFYRAFAEDEDVESSSLFDQVNQAPLNALRTNHVLGCDACIR